MQSGRATTAPNAQTPSFGFLCSRIEDSVQGARGVKKSLNTQQSNVMGKKQMHCLIIFYYVFVLPPLARTKKKESPYRRSM